MDDIRGQRIDFRYGQGIIKQEKTAYQPVRATTVLRRHAPHNICTKYSDVRVAPCFRPNDLLGCDIPLDHKHFVDKSMGLRHFSTKVCEKVKEKGRTNYNQVADELVAEYFAANNMHSEEFLERQKFDQKNIRRRVYDALNVLLAMNIICKRKKDIDWVGLPATKAGEIKRLEEERAKLSERIRNKKETIQALVVQLVAYKSLVWKNREMERINARPLENSVLYLPFVIINTSKGTTVDCAVSGDRSEFLFHFDQSFEVHDDFEALKRLGYSYGLEHNSLNPDMVEHIDEFIPPALRGYIPKILGGEMSDWESRIRSSNQPVQYIIRDDPQNEKFQSSAFDQCCSDHSSDGSYVEMTQPVYASDNYPYGVPAYESEMGEDIELIEATSDYPTYSLTCGSDNYEALNHDSREQIPTFNASEMKNDIASVEYPAVGFSLKAQQNVSRTVSSKKPVYTVAGNQQLRRGQIVIQEGVAYHTNMNTKRLKTEDSVYNG